MIGKLLESVWEYMRGRTWWAAVEPFVLVGLVGLAAQALAYEFVATQYGVRQSFDLFAGSFLSLRITLVTLAALALTWVFTRPRPTDPAPRQRHRLYRFAALALVGLLVGVGLLLSATSSARPITVRVGSLPAGARPDALAYLIYELNRLQRDWYFEIDFREFNPRTLTSSERAQCDSDAQPLLCHAGRMADGAQPTMLVTAEPLAGDVYFATHVKSASVISAAETASYDPLTVYEFLAYQIVVQAIVLHLDEVGGLPANAFERSMRSRGGVLQFLPDRDSLRPTMLAARLSPNEELMLFNHFGPSYLGTCQRLLSMEWLYADRVRTNLAKVFGVAISK